MRSKVVNFLSKILGDSYETSKGNRAYHCPFCNHRKKKLEAHPITGYWHCWVCHARGRNLFQLLKKLKCDKSLFKELSVIVPDKQQKQIYLKKNNDKKVSISLPKEYKPLWIKQNTFDYTTCIKYLYSRGITLKDILKYRLGYCESGQYKNMIIFPNLDNEGNLNYFTTRSFLRNSRRKFQNPPYSRNVVGFEFQTNFNLPITLTEGALDAITIRRNAVPLYGTNIQSELKNKLLDYNINHVFIALDSDAISHSYEIANYLMSLGIQSSILNFEAGTDANSIGFHNLQKYFDNPINVSRTNIFEHELNRII